MVKENNKQIKEKKDDFDYFGLLCTIIFVIVLIIFMVGAFTNPI